jgi:hypothetical protein
MTKKLEYVKKHAQALIAIAGLVSLIASIFLGTYGIMRRIEQVDEDIRTSTQYALKAIIWSSSIPKVERVSACDKYIQMGFNSFTKRYCESLMFETTLDPMRY